jgi:hypothetical protein
MNIADAAEQIAADIRGLGINAEVDDRDLDLPGVWVTPGTIAFDYLDRTAYTITWELWLVAADNGAADALETLGEVLDIIAAPLAITDATAQGVVLRNFGADPLPALRVNLETRITE